MISKLEQSQIYLQLNGI